MRKANVIQLETQDLTPSGEAYCPHPKAEMKLWNTHPRVFFTLVEGQAKCPYCGTEYHVQDSTAQQPVP